MREELTIEAWVFRLPAVAEESFGHYLGRWRRANCLSRSSFGALMGVSGSLVQAWETPSRCQVPTDPQLAVIAELTGVAVSQLLQMLPPTPLHLRTRLCADCYREQPIHRVVWQQVERECCDRHGQPLLCACPACGIDFRLPALWERGCCEHCWLPFTQMRPL